MRAPVMMVALALAATPVFAQQSPARTAAPRHAAPQRPPRDTTLDSTVVAVSYNREVYNYQGGARDPFASLLTDASAQMTINDLRVVSILFDPRGGRSIAVVRDKNSTNPHRLRVGESLGRLRVIQIRPYEVVFQIEEFGFERQEVLTLQRPGVNR